MTAPFWQSYDEQISRWIHSQANSLMDQVMLTITQGGNQLALITATVIFALLLLWRTQRRRDALLYAMAALTSFVLNALLKRFIGRPRPQLWEQLIALPSDASFPSGHAMISMTVYGLAGWMLAQHYPRFRRTILLGAVLLILSIGSSRIYLGVHWPSDVFAGFFFCLVIVIASGHYHHRRMRSLTPQINVTQNEQTS